MSARKITVEDVVKFIEDTGVATAESIAAHFDCHPSTARRNLDGAMYRGLLIEDQYSSAGLPLTKPNWRYNIKEDG